MIPLEERLGAVESLSPEQREIVAEITSRLATIPGVRAVVLGGSHARGRARPGSDVDLGLLYSDAAPFSPRDVGALAEALNDTPSPVVAGLYEWGPWVNGGAWLTVRGHRVDLLYRSLEQLDRVITDSTAGRYDVHHLQQPPFGFFSGIYLGEIATCIPLWDREGLLDGLKRRVAAYPDALRLSVVRDFLFMSRFNLDSFAAKAASRADVHTTAACVTRAVNELAMVLFALNRRYLVSDKTALAEVGEFGCAPRDFQARVERALRRLGSTPDELALAVAAVRELHRETEVLAADLVDDRRVAP